jgi:uncharacterized membrane protein YesL
MNIFTYDSKVMRLLDKLVDCIVLNLIWLIFSLPIFTIGPATAALYYTVDKSICKDRGYVWKEFWNGFKLNFKQGIFAGLAALLVCLVLGVGCWEILLSMAAAGEVSPLGIAYLIIVLFWVMWLHFWLPYIARFQDSTRQMLKNTLILCLTHLPFSLLLLLAAAGSAVLLVCVLPVPVAILVALCLLPSIYTLIVRLILEHIFKKYIPAEEVEEQD